MKVFKVIRKGHMLCYFVDVPDVSHNPQQKLSSPRDDCCEIKIYYFWTNLFLS